MTHSGKAIANAAEEIIGSPFRLHGRNAGTGLDCVGAVVHCLQAFGSNPLPPSGYSLRNKSALPFARYARASGLVSVEGKINAGDILLARVGPGQMHLLIALGDEKFVHADAGLRRVTKLTGPLRWEVLEHWRYHQTD